MVYRIIGNLLKRFIYFADDLRLTSCNEKAKRNNAEKISFMKALIAEMRNVERGLIK
ncbi:MAG: hypothetical protein MJ156_00535 [Alphaproteobacteria bacterium]|nr:hypothetical protein [Alphaproteobacteria bacterium]